MIDSVDDSMEIEENEAFIGDTDKTEPKLSKYSLRSQDKRINISENEVENEDAIPRRIRTRSQCSNVSDVEELDSSPSHKSAEQTVPNKIKKNHGAGHEEVKKSLKNDEDQFVGRRRTRSQCSASDLEELEFDTTVDKKSKKEPAGKHLGELPVLEEDDGNKKSPKKDVTDKRKKVFGKQSIKHKSSIPVIPEDDTLDINGGNKKTPKKNLGKKGKKKFKQKDEEVEDWDVSEKGQEATKESKGGGKKRKAAKSSLIVQLELFSKFKNPRSIAMEPQLRELYLELLVHKSADVQKVVFQCIMSYKYKYLMPYKENFARLLEDKSFKDEIVLFSIDHESSVVSSEHRADVLPVLMRILYGKMHTKTGKGTTGKQYSGVRQSIILRFLSGCKQDELETFINLVFAPFQNFITDNPDRMVSDIRENLDLTKVLPVKKLLGVLNSLDVIFKKMGHLMDFYIPKLIQIIVGMATICCVCLENRQKLIPQVINSLKTIRQLTIYRLIQIFKDYDKYEWRISELDAVFAAVVWPQLHKLPYEGLYHPTPLLKLFHCWSKDPRYFNLLAKHSVASTENSPLPYVLKLLLSKDAAEPVKMFIMDVIDNLLSPIETDELDEGKVIEASHMIKLMSLDALDGKFTTK